MTGYFLVLFKKLSKSYRFPTKNYRIIDLTHLLYLFNGRVINYGVMLANNDENQRGYREFCSSDWTSPNNRPKLIIKYYIIYPRISRLITTSVKILEPN